MNHWTNVQTVKKEEHDPVGWFTEFERKYFSTKPSKLVPWLVLNTQKVQTRRKEGQTFTIIKGERLAIALRTNGSESELMELRGQEKNISMPSSMGFNPPQPNQDPSSNLSSPPIISSLADDKSKNEVYGSSILSPTQTLDHHLLHQHQNHLFNQPQAPPPPRDQNPDPDPDPDPTQIPSSTIAGSSNCKAPQAQPQPKSQPQPQPHQPVSQAQEIASSAHSSTLILYRECLKNHAASTGGHVLDGCGEFMPSGEEGTPGALKCAACECHRNFHRRETDGESQSGANCHKKLCNPIRTDSHRQRITINPIQHPPSHPAPPPHHHYNHHHNHHHRQKYSHGLISSSSTGPVMMAFGSGGGGAPAESSSEDLHNFQSNAGAQPGVQPSFLESKKRFRTKFSKEQKDKMHYFADKLGWKMQNQDEQELEHFCNEVGVKRQVFKVWMHNNKQAMKKKEL